MADIMSKEKRSALMSRIRGRGTKIERLVERELRRRGVYFSTHAKGLPGRPDIVFRNGKLAVFLDGDFWHGWRFPQWKHKLQPFWRRKIASNRERDQRNFRTLRREGWVVLRIWEHQIKRDLDKQVDRICNQLRLLRG
jgi:DNA mismatch endonuclease (patch repair protein)